MDNTIIVYTSDHGERAAAHGMRQKGGAIYREETSVPMFIAHPDGVRGATTHAVVSSVDIARTLLAFAGKDEAWSKATFPQLVGHDVSALTRAPTARTARDDEGHLFNYGVLLSWERTNKNYLDRPVYDLSKRRVHRGVFDSRYKYARYFAPVSTTPTSTGNS